jgi:hypothetical protein
MMMMLMMMMMMMMVKKKKKEEAVLLFRTLFSRMWNITRDNVGSNGAAEV